VYNVDYIVDCVSIAGPNQNRVNQIRFRWWSASVL